MKCLSTLIHSLNTYFTSFYFQNLKKQKYLFTSIVLRSSSYSTKIALKWTKIMLQSSVISIWNPQNQGYKIGNIYNYWDQPWSPKNGLEMLLRILSANTVNEAFCTPPPSIKIKCQIQPSKVSVSIVSIVCRALVRNTSFAAILNKAFWPTHTHTPTPHLPYK